MDHYSASVFQSVKFRDFYDAWPIQFVGWELNTILGYYDDNMYNARPDTSPESLRQQGHRLWPGGVR